jgi:hypothetical protein
MGSSWVVLVNLAFDAAAALEAVTERVLLPGRGNGAPARRLVPGGGIGAEGVRR